MANFTLQQLVLATLAASLLSVFLSTVALWPAARERFRAVRDVVLWIAFVFVLVAVLHYGFDRYDRGQKAPTGGLSEVPPAIDLHRIPRTDRLQPRWGASRNSGMPSPSMSPRPAPHPPMLQGSMLPLLKPTCRFNLTSSIQICPGSDRMK